MCLRTFVCVYICSSSSDADLRGCQQVTCPMAPVNYSGVNRFERAEQLQLQRLSACALYSKVIYVLKALELTDKCQTGQILKDPQSRLKLGWSKHSLVVSGKQQTRAIPFNHKRLLKQFCESRAQTNTWEESFYSSFKQDTSFICKTELQFQICTKKV